MKKVLFIDRDGTLIEEPPDEQVDSLAKVRLMPASSRPCCAARPRLALRDGDQPGRARHRSPSRGRTSICAMQHMLHVPFAGHRLIAFSCARTYQTSAVTCRKPRTGLLTRYLAETALDPERSAVVGDRDTDMELAGTWACGFSGGRKRTAGPASPTP
jgi:imidazoleglycerol-phosphate dehydratase / histidinol-phosphatase